MVISIFDVFSTSNKNMYNPNHSNNHNILIFFSHYYVYVINMLNNYLLFICIFKKFVKTIVFSNKHLTFNSI